MQNKNRIIYIFLIVLGLILYGNTLNNGYSMDDDFVIYKSENVTSGISAFQEIITSHYSDTHKSRYEYRPVVKLSFAFEYSLWKDNPGFSHAVNILIFLLTLLLLFKLLSKLFEKSYPWLPLLSVILFAAHPIHTEVVASLKNRDELLSFFFSIASCLLILKAFDKKKHLYLLFPAILLYFLAYFSKSSALVFAALIPLTLYFYSPKKWKISILIFIILLAAAWFSRYYPKTFLPEASRDVWLFENPLYENKGILYRLGTGLVALLFYLKILFVPYPLRFYYGYDMIPLSKFPDTLSIISLIIHLALFIFAIYKIRQRHPLSFAILFYLIAISMFSNILKPAVGIVAERYVYTASLGFIIAISYLLLKVFNSEKISFGKIKVLPSNLKYILIGLIIIYGARTISRNTAWKDHLTLYYNDIKHLSGSFKANLLIANTLQSEAVQTHDQPKHYKRNQQYIQDAETYYQAALNIYDKYANAWNSYGSLKFMFKNDIKAAIPMFKEAVELDPMYTEALFNLGFCYQKIALNDSAIFYFNASIESNDQYQRAYIQLAQVELLSGDTNAFFKCQDRLMKAMPESDSPYLDLGTFYIQIGDTNTAFQYWEKAAELEPNNPPLLMNLANFYLRQGNQEKYNYYINLYNEVTQKRRKEQKRWQ